MNKITNEDPQTGLEHLPKDRAKYSNNELFEFASHLGSMECPHSDLAVAFAAYIGLNVEMICYAWEYRFYNSTSPHDKRGEVLATFDEIVALIKRNVGA